MKKLILLLSILVLGTNVMAQPYKEFNGFVFKKSAVLVVEKNYNNENRVDVIVSGYEDVVRIYCGNKQNRNILYGRMLKWLNEKDK